MRELTQDEVCCVGGAAVNFTSQITLGLLNNVADATVVGRATALSFGIGYAIGTWLNNTFNISTRIVDAIY
jgi:hypothetical protein